VIKIGLDIFCRQDIANALLAAEEASSATAAAMLDGAHDVEKLRAYRQGYRAALTAVALAFGLSPREEKLEVTFTATFSEWLRPSELSER
jgi:hypothetical protein